MKKNIFHFLTISGFSGNAKTIALNSGWLFFERIVRLTLGLLVGAWVARYLGPEKYGVFTYFIAYIALFGAVVNLGLDGIVVRECLRAPAESSRIVSTAFYLRLGTGIFCWGLSIGIMLITEGASDALILTVIAGITLVFQSTDTFDLWFQSQSRNRISVFTKLLSFGVCNGLKVAFIVSKVTLIYFIILSSFEVLLTGIILTLIYKKNSKNTIQSFSKVIAKKLLIESWPFLLSSLSVILYMRIDQIFVKNILGAYYLGQYSTGIVFSQFWYFLPVILFTAISPHITSIREHSKILYFQKLAVVFRVFLVLGIVVTVFNYIFADLMVSVIYGEQYREAISILRIHSFTNIFVYMGVAQNIWIINEGLGKLNLIKTTIGTITAIIGNLVLLPIIGINGAAYTAVAVQALSAFISNIFLAPKIFLMQIGITVKNDI